MDISPALLAQLRQGMPLTVVGSTNLPSRLGRLVVLARGDGKRTHLAAAFMGIARQPQLSDVRFEFSRGPLNQLVLFAGSWPILVPLVGPRVRPIPAEDLEPALSRFCELVDITAGSSVELTLSPDGHRVETAIDGIGQLFARIRSGNLGGNRPGRVFQPDAEDEDSITLADIGGLETAKGELETICLAVRDPKAFSAWGARPPRGILLYGPPGTGKTMLARALARESAATFIHVRATDVVSKWYGEAEQKLQQSFDWARKEKPSVLFFDEIDALAPDRDGAHEATHRLVTTFLENMDGLDSGEGVIVVAATNRPDSVDDALTRPGRFDRLVEVPLPDAEGRRMIFEIHLRRAGRKAGRQVFADPDEEDWKRLVAASAGHSGAEIAEAVRRALESKVKAGKTVGMITPDELLAQTHGSKRGF